MKATLPAAITLVLALGSQSFAADGKRRAVNAYLAPARLAIPCSRTKT
jgi:hypothetical protein